jgi:DNA-binding NtrC family response regulator
VVMTGHPTVEGASALFNQGVVDYLVKPVDPQKLIATVGKAVSDHVLFKDQFNA